ncbi:MAG: hypothetical protein H0U76_02015 [Ktedonobacteraceae bacterium]|nr:hypothetical protein [Ktedonobacteraceae bacterium]
MVDTAVAHLLAFCEQRMAETEGDDWDRYNAYEYVARHIRLMRPRWRPLVIDLVLWTHQKRQVAAQICAQGMPLAMARLYELTAKIYEDLTNRLAT